MNLDTKLPSPLDESLCLGRGHGDSLTLAEEGRFDDSDFVLETSDAVSSGVGLLGDPTDADQQPSPRPEPQRGRDRCRVVQRDPEEPEAAFAVRKQDESGSEEEDERKASAARAQPSLPTTV